MTLAQTAHGLRSAYGLPYAGPGLVLAWESGALCPNSRELTALAGVLWCSPNELTGRSRSLRQHRLAQGLAAEDVALAVGLDHLAYLRMEENDEWRGTERQSAVLAELLRLSLPDLVAVTGREPRLAALLYGAVTARWQAYVRPVERMLPLRRRLIERALRELHLEYEAHRVRASGRTREDTADRAGHTPHAPGSAAADPGQDFLDRIVEHFWTKAHADGG